MARSVYTLTIPSSTQHLETVREFVGDHARAAGFSDESVEQLKIAVDEACTNVIEHAYGGEAAHQIGVSVIVQADRFTIRIQDEGKAFDPRTYKEPNIFEYAKRRKAGGFGVHIMHRLMDHVEYRKRGAVNECCMTKYRNNAH